MADADDVRRLASALPGVREIDSDGFDFRVSGSGFIWSYPERLPGRPRVIRTDIAVLYVGDEAEKQALLLGEPNLFFTAPGYDGAAQVLLRLPAVDTGRLAELVTDAWRMRAGDGAVPPDDLLTAAGMESDDATAGPPPPSPTPAVIEEPEAREPTEGAVLTLTFDGEIFQWRGPAPYHFVAVPDTDCRAIAAAASRVTYGWGMIPVVGRIGGTSFTTSLWPRDGGYVVPVKVAVQRAESLQLGDTVTVDLDVVPPR